MQSIGMTGKQLRRLMVYEGIYYAAGADIIGGAVAAIMAVTVLKSALNGPSMWFFTLNITLVPVLVIGVLYLLLAVLVILNAVDQDYGTGLMVFSGCIAAIGVYFSVLHFVGLAKISQNENKKTGRK